MRFAPIADPGPVRLSLDVAEMLNKSLPVRPVVGAVVGPPIETPGTSLGSEDVSTAACSLPIRNAVGETSRRERLASFRAGEYPLPVV